MTRVLALAFALLAAAGIARAQSLGELAEQEKAKKKDPKAKTYTEDDLKKYTPPKAKASPAPTPGALPPDRKQRPKPTSTPRPDQGSGASEGAHDDPPSGAEEATPTPTNEIQWRTRAAELRKAIELAERRVAGIEARIRDLRTPQSQPNPMDAQQQDPNHLLTPDPQRQALERELTQAQADKAKAERDLANLEEEARKKGVPPGWLRE